MNSSKRIDFKYKVDQTVTYAGRLAVVRDRSYQAETKVYTLHGAGDNPIRERYIGEPIVGLPWLEGAEHYNTDPTYGLT